MKKLKSKRIWAMLLAACMMITMLPVSALAADTGTASTTGTTVGEPFPQGTAGSNSFRIPALTTLSNGDLLAAADARWNTTYDGGCLDTIVSRSTDDGANWSWSFANYLGDNGDAYDGSSTAFIDPALATTSDDTIYMLCDLYPYGVALNGNKDTIPAFTSGFYSDTKLKLSSNSHSSYSYYLDLTDYKIYNYSTGAEVTGYTVDEYFNITDTNGTVDTNLFFEDSPYKVVRTGYLYLTSSTDGGATWSAPTLLNLKTTSEMVCLVAPGRGLVTSDGTIVFPVYSYSGYTSSQMMGFIYSTDGVNWSRSSNFTGASWSSESSVVELPNGNLRFFYRNGTTNLCYADYNMSSGSWGSATNTYVATNSNCQISALLLERTAWDQQVLLVSCPTGPSEAGSYQSGASYRLNGKIFVYTINNDGTGMTYRTSIDVSGTAGDEDPFMYSCLTALKDENGKETGKIGILYEDKENAWGTGSNCYYTMDYKTFDLNDYVTLDAIDDSGKDDTDDDVIIGESGEVIDKETGVSVLVEDENVTMSVTEVTDVDALNGGNFVAYDITPYTSDGTAYQGSATVKFPLKGKFASDANLAAFYIDENGKIAETISGTYDAETDTFAFPVTHFSTYAVGEATVSTNKTAELTLPVKLTTGQYVEWTSADPHYVGVAGEFDYDKEVYTNVGVIAGYNVTSSPVTVSATIYNADGTAVNTYEWQVTVNKGTSNANYTSKYIYIDIARIQNCTVYYSINGGELVKITDDMLEVAGKDAYGNDYYKLKVPLMDEQYYRGFQIMFFADPDEGYALTSMSSTNSLGQYYTLSDGVNPDGTDSSAWPFADGYDWDSFDALSEKPAGSNTNVYDTTVGMRWGLVEGNLTVAQMKVVYSNALAIGCDGVLCFTKNSKGTTNGSTTHFGGNDLVSDLQFIADKLPEISKTVNGVLGTSGLESDFRTYEEGMVAAVGEYVYFTVTVKLEAPLVWENSTNRAALRFTDKATLIDNKLDGAYFYTKDLDTGEDGKLDGILNNDANKLTQQDVLALLDAKWTAAEIAAGERVLEYYVVYPIQESDLDKDIVNTAVLDYSYKSSYSQGKFSAQSDALADIHVVGKYIDPVVVDFGQSVSIEDTGNEYLFRNMDHYASTYGRVDISADEDIYTLTYTPTKIMEGPDTVILYDQNNKSINSIVVYPATTVYYEENFVHWDTTNENKKWSVNGTASIAAPQDLDWVGDTTKNYNYGYDPIYTGGNTASNGTQATTSAIGASGSFTFTGTGVEVYANSAADTGYVSVQIKDNAGKSVKLFMVDTRALSGSTGATADQTGSLYSVPIVSIQDLDYGKYTVNIRKIMDAKPVNIDGVRVFGTMKSESIYETDGESGASYVELRDMVLDAVSVTENDSKYYDETAESILDQVYASAGTALGAVVLNDEKYNSYDTKAVQDMLDNGPKNELYLHPGETVVFDLDGVAQIGMKTVNGADVSYDYSTRGGAANSYTMQSSTDMFYHNDAAGRVTITNTSKSGLLSITLLKCWMAVGYSQDGFAGIMAALFGADDDAASPLRELTKDDIVYALEMMNQSLYGTEDEEKTPVYDMFTDVIKDEWYCTAIQYVFDNELMVGISSDMFGTYSSMTRAMLMQVLYAAEGKPEASDKNFTDVAADAWYADAVSWGAQNGLTAGYGDGRFGAEDKVTREQLATILRAYAKMKQMENKDGGITLDQFTDNSSISNWAQDSMLWAVNQGIISGRPGGILDPQGNATRAELAQMIYALVKE